jgi:hypothetical protein
MMVGESSTSTVSVEGITVTPKVQVSSTPQLLSAEQVTMVDPLSKAVPDGGSQVTVNAPSQLSTAKGGG